MKCTVESLLVGVGQSLGASTHVSGIAKEAVAGRTWLDKLGFDGDEQADRKFHGGPDKAVHHYAFDHYSYWTAQIGARPVLTRPGAFGENLSTTGYVEADVCIGDVFSLGEAVVQVSQARQPCWKLNIRFDCPGMSAQVQESGRTGWYYRVLSPGWVAPGDTLALLERRCPDWPLARILDVLYRHTTDREALSELAQLDALMESWRKLFARRLERGTVEDWSFRLNGAAGEARS
ncbi:MAG TPA: MOSC domain-containing protein [Noviherbaspirillum sp.]|uniref:MOSC domain-containing protein n=1 Tax=Noviherbaspirillum sp. TaxID=1926288 RepID=UPI002B4A90B1|nr:MOSC domain-containing protein [Noviherbaspirillum sp.]HJV85346.1 MOSC domain-containing protein [Noviherbaspirillum sp.]